MRPADPHQNAGIRPAPAADRPRLVVAGAGGPIGRALVTAAADRYDPVVLTRGGTRRAGARAVTWDPATAAPDAAGVPRDEAALAALARTLDGAAGVINLAGASIAAGRLGRRHLERLRASREASAGALTAALARCAEPPPVFVQASGVDAYGPAGEATLDEEAPLGDGPLAEVLRATEAAAAPAAAHARLVTLRIGMVLADDALAWHLVLLPIRLFVGGPLGRGTQWWPWVHADDLARAVLWLVDRSGAQGVYNVVGEPVRQRELARAAARRLRRPAFLPVPAVALRIAVGGLAEPLLLASKRVVASRLVAEGFTFRHPDIASALDDLLGPPHPARRGGRRS